MSGEVINKVAQSSLITFKLEDLYPQGDRVCIDLKDRLFMGMILREKDLREWAAQHDWSQYQDKYVALTCTVDTLIQTWAWMLLEVHLYPYAKHVCLGSLQDLEAELFRMELDALDFSAYEGKPVVVKGCGEIDIPPSVYMDVTRRLLPYAKKISFGEPCSTVPLYKK